MAGIYHQQYSFPMSFPIAFSPEEGDTLADLLRPIRWEFAKRFVPSLNAQECAEWERRFAKGVSFALAKRAVHFQQDLLAANPEFFPLDELYTGLGIDPQRSSLFKSQMEEMHALEYNAPPRVPHALHQMANARFDAVYQQLVQRHAELYHAPDLSFRRRAMVAAYSFVGMLGLVPTIERPLDEHYRNELAIAYQGARRSFEERKPECVDALVTELSKFETLLAMASSQSPAATVPASAGMPQLTSR